MTTTILFWLGLFVTLIMVFLYLVPATSAESALLDEVTRKAKQRETVVTSLRSRFNLEFTAAYFRPLGRLFSAKPDSDLVYRLMLAGYRKPAHADIYLGTRLALPSFLGFLVALLVSDNVVVLFIFTFIVAFFLPDFWLGRAIKKRRERIRLSLPDSLDLLVICMEAGLGMDQGMVKVGQELAVSHRELSEEFLQINFEQRAGVPRMAAWKAFAKRADVESVRSFVAMLIQTDRFGTPISKSLAAFSDSLRTQRRQLAEERAAKTTIKLVPPLVFFIFPSMGIVLVGPAVITLLNNIGLLAKPQ